MYFISWLAGVALSCFVIWQVIKSYRSYPRLKQALALGDPQARPRFYKEILRFEWISALLALVALGFDRTKLLASALEMNDTAFARWVSSSDVSGKTGMTGIAAGLVIGLVLLAFIRLRARRAQVPAAMNTKVWWRRFVPDVGPLIPVTRGERWLFAAAAVSAGICEEIVFRGWLLYTLHTPLGFTGTALILVAAALFGLCHIYQGVTGVVGTTLAGALLSAVYIGTGTLLIPMVLHVLIDLRVAILPSSLAQTAQPPMGPTLGAGQKA